MAAIEMLLKDLNDGDFLKYVNPKPDYFFTLGRSYSVIYVSHEYGWFRISSDHGENIVRFSYHLTDFVKVKYNADD